MSANGLFRSELDYSDDDLIKDKRHSSTPDYVTTIQATATLNDQEKTRTIKKVSAQLLSENEEVEPTITQRRHSRIPTGAAIVIGKATSQDSLSN